MGGIASIFSPSKPKRQYTPPVVKTASQVATDEAAARKAKKEDEKRKGIAFKLAQIATGAGGILSDAPTSRKKLFGN